MDTDHRTPTRGVGARLAITALAAVALGATPVAGQDATTGPGTPVQGGTLRFAMQQEPACHNAHVGPQYAAQTLTRLLADSLVSQKLDGSGFEPWLATSWEATPDARHYTFTLREDVTFHDGTRLDAAAVKANFDNAADPAAKNAGAALFLGTAYEGAEVLADNVVRIDFSRGQASFLQAASTPYLGIQSPATLSTDGECKGAVGSGPFIFESYTPQGSFIVDRNPDYAWGPAYAQHTGPAYLDRLEFQFVLEEATRTGSLTSGQIDGIDGASARQIDQLQQQGFGLIRSDQPGQPWMGHINDRTGPTADVEVRRALREAIDFDTIIAGLWGGRYYRSWGPITQFTVGYEPAVENAWSYDPVSANARLDAAGWTERGADGIRVKDGQRLSFVWITDPNEQREQRPDFIQAVQEQVKDVGIEIELISISYADAAARRAAWDFGIFAHSYVRAEPAQLDRILHSQSNPISGFSDPEVDAWLEAAQATTDPAARAAEYSKVQLRSTDLAVTLPVYAQTQFVFFSPQVHGVATDASGWLQYYDAWKDPS